jgi:hypothetical protein
MSQCIRKEVLYSKRMGFPVIQMVMLEGGRKPTKLGVLSTGQLKSLIWIPLSMYGMLLKGKLRENDCQSKLGAIEGGSTRRMGKTR